MIHVLVMNCALAILVGAAIGAGGPQDKFAELDRTVQAFLDRIAERGGI